MFHLKSNYIMTKIYVVKGAKYNNEDSNFVAAVFTNLRKAEAYRDYWNISMNDKDYFYWVRSYEIETTDYTSLLNSIKKRG